MSVALWGQSGAPGIFTTTHRTQPEVVTPQSDPEPGDDPDPNLGFLFGVFIVTWAGFFGYAFMVSRRQRELQKEIGTLRAVIEGRREQEEEPG